MTKALQYIEIDVPYCELRYGETTDAGTCPAVLGTDSDIKCFNTVKTCAVRASFLEQDVTLRFAVDTGYLPDDIDAIPSITDITLTPAVISLGEDLGQRATLSVTFRDHPHSDAGAGYDKYLDDRDYDPFLRGTFWGKFRARQPYLQGRALRWINGSLGQTLEMMETHHFIIDSFDGPTPDGEFTLTAKDVLKLTDGDQSQAPVMSPGFLTSDAAIDATSLSLSPPGVGSNYPASGYAAIGGKEIVSFTRSGDIITLTGRGLSGTDASALSAQDRFQLVLNYTPQDVSTIIYDLMTSYAGIPADYINLAEWQTETTTFLNRFYSAQICEPTSVQTLIAELIEQACLVIWWDDIARKIRLQVLRALDIQALALSPENIIEGSLQTSEQPDQRISQVWTYFGIINPLKSQSDPDNFASTSIVTDDQAEIDYGAAVIKKIYSRWIPRLGRTIADRLGAIQIGRFRDPPRKISFDTARNAGTDLALGGRYLVTSQSLQDDTGATVNIPVQVTKLNAPPDRFSCESQEILFAGAPDDSGGGEGGGPRTWTIIVDSDSLNVNLRNAYNAIYPSPADGDTIVCHINSGVTVGSMSTAFPSFEVGDWSEDVTIRLEIAGDIRGPGGNGGNAGVGYPSGGGVISTVAPQPGFPGGTALYTRRAITIALSGVLAGGGGGGGGNTAVYGGGGGGGAGSNPGTGGTSQYQAGSPGAKTAGGAAGVGNGPAFAGGKGGAPGVAGSPANSTHAIITAGGAAGHAIDGISFITFESNTGSIVGATIN